MTDNLSDGVIQKNLANAFRELRKMGFIALQNFSCCQTCGNAEIAQRAEKMEESKRQQLKGRVFFHYQDNQDRRNGHNFYLSFGTIHSDEYGYLGFPATECGRIVSEILVKHGVPHKWDGNKQTRILIIQEKD